MLSTQMASFDILDSFGDLRLEGSSGNKLFTSPPVVRTFTRLNGLNNCSSNSSLFYTKPIETDSIAQENMAHQSCNSSNSNSIAGRSRFKPVRSSLVSKSSDYLKDSSVSDPSYSYVAHRHYERKDIQGIPLLALSPESNQTVEHSHARKVGIHKPRPTFTRVAKLHNNAIDSNTNHSSSSSSSNTDGDNWSDKISQLDDAGMQHSDSQLSSSLLRQDEMSLPVVRGSRLSPLSVSPLPSAVPSLTSASTCSSSSPLSPSDRKDWWFSLDHTNVQEPVESRSGVESESEDGDEEGEQPMTQECMDPELDTQDDTLHPLQHGFQRIKPKTYSQARTRFSALPPLYTGFCSISQTSIESSEEPSLQDFLGEADVPFPSPFTLQERQARQQRRAEQLRQLELHEEREDRENRRVERRRASFSAGMGSTLATPSLSSSAPASLSRSFIASQSSTRLCQQHQQDQPIAVDQLGRSTSSPVNISSTISRKSRRCVRFDLRKTRIFEYDVVEEWRSSSPSCWR